MTFIKFCGMTREEDVARACELGIDAVGFVLWPGSARYVPAERVAALVRMLPSNVTPVGVFVSPTREEMTAARGAGVRVVQIHGPHAEPHDDEEDVWVATSLDAGVATIAPRVTVVLDAHDPVRHGGTGRTIDWARAAAVAASRRVMLAGGLTPGNVAEAIRQVRPFGVDVASGIEDQPGIKDAQAMTDFVAAVRGAHA
jgi:phosphoribosylanthranilate isomerase